MDWVKIIHILCVMGWMTSIFAVPRALIYWKRAAAGGDATQIGELTYRLYRFSSGLGLIAAPLLYWRVRTRFAHGYPRITELSLPFNLGARLVMFALLACIFTLMVTGPLIPLLNGEPYRIFGWFSFTIPFPHFDEAAAIAETAHAIAGHSLMILFALHMLDALTHHFFDKDTILVRMLKPIRNGK